MSQLESTPANRSSVSYRLGRRVLQPDMPEGLSGVLLPNFLGQDAHLAMIEADGLAGLNQSNRCSDRALCSPVVHDPKSHLKRQRNLVRSPQPVAAAIGIGHFRDYQGYV